MTAPLVPDAPLTAAEAPCAADDHAADIRLVLAGLRAVSVEATRRSGGLVEEDRAVFVALGDEHMPEAFAAYERLREAFAPAGGSDVPDDAGNVSACLRDVGRVGLCRHTGQVAVPRLRPAVRGSPGARR